MERHRELKQQEENARKLDGMKVSDIPGYEDVVFRVEEVKLPWENTGTLGIRHGYDSLT